MAQEPQQLAASHGREEPHQAQASQEVANPHYTLAAPADIVALAVVLKERGCDLLTRDKRLFVNHADRLTIEERRILHENKIAFRKLAIQWPTTVVQVLNTPAPRIAWTAQEPPILDGIDTIVLNVESTGLNWAGNDEIIGITVGTLDQQLVRFLPYGFREGNLNRETVLRWYQEQVKHKHILNANIKFDIHMSRKAGVDLEAQGNTVSDIQHWAALLDDHRRRFGLDILAKDFLGGVEVPRQDESRMATYAADEVAARAEYQVKLVAQLREKMWPMLDAQNLQRVRQLEDDVIYPVVEMEKNGALLDVELLAEYKRTCEQRRNALLMEISEEVGYAFEFTVESWQRLFEKYKLPIAHLDTGRPTFAEDVLAPIDHPVVKKARFAAQLDSLNNKTFKPYSSAVGSDGVLRFELNQLRGDDGGTVSGRFSAPYIQQVPNHDNHVEIFGEDLFPRRLYIPGPGMRYFAGDAMQIEYRIFAHEANNAAVIEAYAKDPYISFHKMVHQMFLPYKPDMNYTHQKRFNFMKLYGGQLVKLATMMGHITEEEGEEIRKKKTQKSDPRLAVAREIESLYNKLLPEVDYLLKKYAHLAAPDCDEFCNQSVISRQLHDKYQHQGFVATMIGRRSRFDSHRHLHKAFNRFDQGTGADILKMKIVELHRERKHTGFLMRMTVHDELTGDVVDDESAERVKTILNQQSLPMRVPILWSGQTGANWADCK